MSQGFFVVKVANEAISTTVSAVVQSSEEIAALIKDGRVPTYQSPTVGTKAYMVDTILAAMLIAVASVKLVRELIGLWRDLQRREPPS